jgi:hypothetical protein
MNDANGNLSIVKVVEDNRIVEYRLTAKVSLVVIHE